MASNKAQLRALALHVGVNLLLALGAFLILLPFIWMLSLSVKPENEIYVSSIRFLTSEWDFENYFEELEFGEVGTFVKNGLAVTLTILAIQMLTVIPAAYVLARKHFKLEKVSFGLVLTGLIVPQQAVVIPLVLAMAKLDLLNTFPVLVIPFMTSALGIFLLRQNFKAVPQELIDAALVDGASERYILWFILVPLVKPALAAFAVFSIVSHWNDFFWPLLVVNDLSLATPPLGISIFASDEGGNDVGPMMASATIIVAPLLVAFLCARRWFIQGITLSGLK